MNAKQQRRVDALTRLASGMVTRNACHLTELLRENEGIVIGRSTLDSIIWENSIINSGSRRLVEEARPQVTISPELQPQPAPAPDTGRAARRRAWLYSGMQRSA